MYDLERAKIWERFACIDQFRYWGVWDFDWTRRNSPRHDARRWVTWARTRGREEDGEFGEPRISGHKS